jgi:hypothetical protein
MQQLVPERSLDITSSGVRVGDDVNLTLEEQPLCCDGSTRILWETRHSRYDVNAVWFTQLLQRFRNYICRIIE